MKTVYYCNIMCFNFQILETNTTGKLLLMLTMLTKIQKNIFQLFQYLNVNVFIYTELSK